MLQSFILRFIIEWIERDLVADEGVGIPGDSSKTLEECKILCGETDNCNSFSWSAKWGCYLKEKCITENEPSKSGGSNEFKSYYKPCKESGIFVKINAPQ